MEHMSYRIKQARELRGLSQEALAELSGTSQSVITDVERGRTEMPRGINRIAKALGLTFDQLLTGDLRAIILGEGPADRLGVAAGPSPQPLVALPPEYCRVRMLRSFLGAGNTKINEDDHYTEVAGGIVFRCDSLARRGLIIDGLLVGFNFGESMAPTFIHNTAIMFDITEAARDQIIDDEIYAIQYVQANGDAQVKRIFRQGGKVRIVSDNPDKGRYPDVFVAPDEIRYIGRYAWAGAYNPKLPTINLPGRQSDY